MINTKIGDLEWPWTAHWPCSLRYFAEFARILRLLRKIGCRYTDTFGDCMYSPKNLVFSGISLMAIFA